MPNNSEPQHKFNDGGVLPNLVEMAKLGIAGIDLLLKNPPLDATNTITKGENAKMTFYTIKENDSYGTLSNYYMGGNDRWQAQAIHQAYQTYQAPFSQK